MQEIRTESLAGRNGINDRTGPPGKFETLKETVMSKEMSTGETEARLDLLIAQAQSLLKDLVERKAALAEAEKPKPKPRHGAYGVDEDGPFFLWENRHLWTKEYEPGNNKCLSRSLNKKGNDERLKQWATEIDGNIFDDRKALSQPLHNFTADVHPYGFDFENFRHTPILIAGNWHTVKDAEEISMKLQRLLHTAKQVEPKNR